MAMLSCRRLATKVESKSESAKAPKSFTSALAVSACASELSFFSGSAVKTKERKGSSFLASSVSVVSVFSFPVVSAAAVTLVSLPSSLAAFIRAAAESFSSWSNT
jgi:hypothetical protein